MKIERESGSWSRFVVHDYLSWQTNGTGAATKLRDGKTGLLTSAAGSTGTGNCGAVRTAPGTWTVTVNAGRPILEDIPVVFECGLTAGSATPTAYADAYYVEGSWALSADHRTATFQVIIQTAASTVADPDSGARVWVHIVGSISAASKDPA